MYRKYQWGALKTYQCPTTTEFVKRLEESSWGACTAQTVNYIIMDSEDKLPVLDIKFVICDKDTDRFLIIAGGAIPVYVSSSGNLWVEGGIVVSDDINSVLEILNT